MKDVRYALNVKKGSTINHPHVTLKGGVAVPVSAHIANQLKNIMNVVIFERVEGVDHLPTGFDKKSKSLYGMNRMESLVKEEKRLKEANSEKEAPQETKIIQQKQETERKKRELLNPKKESEEKSQTQKKQTSHGSQESLMEKEQLPSTQQMETNTKTEQGS